MSGCYGGSAEDRYRERQLDRFLDSQGDDEDQADSDFNDRLNIADEKYDWEMAMREEKEFA